MHLGATMRMSAIVMALVVAFVATSGASAAAKGKPAASHKALPSFEITGHRIGDPAPTTKPEEKSELAGVQLYVPPFYYYDDGKFASFSATFMSAGILRMKDALEAKYGSPSVVRTETVQNGYGAKRQNTIWEWRFSEGTLRLHQYFSSIDTSYLEFENPALRAKEAAERKAKATEAAKGL